MLNYTWPIGLYSELYSALVDIVNGKSNLIGILITIMWFPYILHNNRNTQPSGIHTKILILDIAIVDLGFTTLLTS